MKYLSLSFLALLSVVHSAYSFQGGGSTEDPFGVSYDEGPILVSPGETHPFQAEFEIPENYYLYEESVEINFAETPEGMKIGKMTKDEGEEKDDPFSGHVVPVYYIGASARVSLTLPSAPWEGELVAKGDIQYQGCSDQLCYRVMHLPFEVSFVSRGTKSISVNTTQKGFWAKLKLLLKEGNFHKVVEEGLFFAMFLAFLGGVLTDFTPCVWPMIPVTLAHLGVKKNHSLFQNFIALIFLILGMGVMYSFLGILAAFLGKGLGFVFQNIGFLILLDLVLFAMAASFLGLFEFHLPSKIVSQVARVNVKGYAGDFFIGLTMGIMAAPCVGPVVGPLLVFVAQTKDMAIGFWLLLSYALGIGSLFMVLGMGYRLFHIRFRGGKWTLWFERFLGIVLLVVGLYYAGIIYKELRGSPSSQNSYWLPSLSEGINRAHTDEKPVVIDFFARWCAPCLELDRFVWNDEKITQKIKENWVAIKIDCTQETPHCKEATDRYNVVGWPTIIFLDRNQEEVEEERLVGKVVEAEEMEKILERVEHAN